MTKPLAKPTRGRNADGQSRLIPIVSYCTESEARIVDQLTGIGKRFRSSSDLMRTAFGEYVKQNYPDFVKELRSDLTGSV